MRFGLTIAALLLTACGRGENATDAPSAAAAEAPSSPSPAKLSSPSDTHNGVGGDWELRSSGEGVALALLAADGSPTIRLFCPSKEDRLRINIPSFRPIASEERLSFGAGGVAIAFVVDSRGDAPRGGVSGAGAVPDNLAALVGDRLSASYGAQRSGPHPAPPQKLSRAFVAACGGTSAAGGKPQPGSTGACLMEGSKRLRVTPLRAIGTEPFWAARIEGRCVNYSHPENQDGTRVWTRYRDHLDGGAWSGALGGQPFELRTRAQPGCSDGMSDKRYPLAVELVVHGEQRTGCAEPI